jgi:hypothetical protein
MCTGRNKVQYWDLGGDSDTKFNKNPQTVLCSILKIL